MKPIRFCLLLIFFLCAVIVGLIIMYFSMKRRRTYWKNKAIAEARKRLRKDDANDQEHRRVIGRYRNIISDLEVKINELERNNNVLRQLNEQLTRHKEGGTTCL